MKALRWLAALALPVLPALCAPPPPAPSIRFVEIGDDGVIAPEAPAWADVEISSHAAFRGTLDAVLRMTDARDWKDEPFFSDRHVVTVDMKAGERRLVSLFFPESTGWFGFARISWVLRGAEGEAVARGDEAAQVDFHPHDTVRVLKLTAEPGEGFRRSPARAFERTMRYRPYAVVVVSAQDLLALSAKQQECLRDAVALGLRLVVTGAFGSLGALWDPIVSREENAWRGSDGLEIREATYLWGGIRRTNLPLFSYGPFSKPDGPDAIRYMLATLPNNLSLGNLNAFGEGRSSIGALTRFAVSDEWERRRNQTGGVMPVLFLGALAFLWRSSRSDRPLSRGGIAKGAAVLTIGLVAVGALFASVAGGKTEERTTCRFHDPGGERDVVQTARFTGGGAGGVDRPLAFDLDSPNVLWLDRHTPTGLHSVRLTTVSAGGTSSASIGTPAFTGTNLVSLVAISLLPPAPAWEVRARREKGRLQGTIRFDRLLRSVAVVDGRSVFTVGSVSPGSVVDLSSLGPAMSLKAFWESSGRGDVSLAERARFGPAGWGTFSQRAGDLLVLGEEVSTSAGAAERCVHVERVRIAGDRPAPLLRAPGWQEKLEIHVVVPSNVRGPFTAFSGNLFFASQRPDRVIARPDGYQELAFRGLRPYLASEHRARADVPPQVFEVTMRVGEVRDGV